MPAIIVLQLLLLHVLLTLPHELGHFAAARLLGVAVPEFGIGLPPTIGAVRWRGTRWSLNLLPIGAFIGYSSINARPNPRRTTCAIAIAGSTANLLFAIFCLVLLIAPESANMIDLGRSSARHLVDGLTHPWGGDEIVSMAALTIPGLGKSLGQWMTATDFLRLLVSASLAVGFINLLPIPPLDGSKLLFSLLRAIGCRQDIERSISRAGFVGFSLLAFIGLVLAVTTHV